MIELEERIVKDVDMFGKIGRFKVPWKSIKENPRVFMKLMSKMIVVEATNHFHDMTLEYTAYSDLFEPQSEESEIPLYIVVTSNEEGEAVHWYTAKVEYDEWRI